MMDDTFDPLVYAVKGASSLVGFGVGTESAKELGLMTSNIGRALTQTDFTSTSSAGIGYFEAMSYNEKFRKPYGLLEKVC